jgi:hypothetical protein
MKAQLLLLSRDITNTRLVEVGEGSSLFAAFEERLNGKQKNCSTIQRLASMSRRPVGLVFAEFSNRRIVSANQHSAHAFKEN